MGTTAAGTRAGVPEEQTAPRSDRGWLLRVLAVVVVFALVAWVRSRQVDIPFRDPHGKLFRSKIVSSLGILLVLVVLDAVVRSIHRGASWRTPLRVLRERWTLRRTAIALGGLLGYFVVYLSYRNLKSWDVLNTPRDAMLQRWDKALFLGHSPAVLLHDLLGRDLAARVLTDWYESFSTVIMVALLAALAFAPRIRQGMVFLTAAMWAWILGVASYYLIPSLGPFHVAPQEFSGLTRTSIQHTQETYVAQRAHFLANPQAGDAFAQISAFASLHCALTCLVWLMARYYGLRRLSWVCLVYLVGVVVATVYLGWHFAVDDIAGLTIAWLSFQLGKLTVLGSWRSATRAPANP
jgi:hypothetical protein